LGSTVEQTPFYAEALQIIEDACEGELKFVLYEPGEHPFEIGDFLPAIRDGNFDLCYQEQGWASGVEPILMGMRLPLFFGGGSFDEYYFVADDPQVRSLLYEEPLKTRWNAIPILWVNEGICYFYGTKFYRSFEDTKGQIFRGWGTDTTAVTEAIGGVATVIPYSEAYTAMARGVATGSPLGIF